MHTTHMSEPSSWTATLRPLSTTEAIELWLLQLGLMLLGTYFAVGVLTSTPHAWPLLMGPGPFFALLCVYLGCQLQRRTPHLYALVRFVTVFSVPYAGMALARGFWLAPPSERALHIGYVPPVLLAAVLVLRLGAWRRMFDAEYEDGTDMHGALALELFAGVCAWCAALCGVSFTPQLAYWARSQADIGQLLALPLYTVMLCKVMLVPALVAACVGAALYVRSASRGALMAALVFTLVLVVVHALMLAFFAQDGWSWASGVLWSLVLLGFAVHLARLVQTREPVAVRAAPTVF